MAVKATSLFKQKFRIHEMDSGEKIVISSYSSRPTVEQVEDLLADEEVELTSDFTKLFEEVENG